MNYSIPLSYKLDIRDLIHNNDNISNEIQINNFKLFVNKKYLIYKIQSNISLEFLLDFLFNYEEIIIGNLYLPYSLLFKSHPRN